MINTLFDLSETKKERPLHRCRGCKHMVTHFYNKGFKYCQLQRSNRTGNGLKKIKANDPSCIKFEPK